MTVSRRTILAGAAAFAAAAPRRAHADTVQIEYWQYYFKERVTAMSALIAQFQAANPGITVRQTTFPYEQYRTKISAAVPAGGGPDVVQLYYGWLRDFRRAGLLQPLPTDVFPPANIDRDFYPITQQMKSGGVYYGLPTAVRSMGLFVNDTLMKDAGIAGPPPDLDAFLADAKRIVRFDANNNMIVAGTTIGLPSQDSHWWREVLVRQFGGVPYSDDYRTVRYGSPEGAAALQWYADLQLRDRVAQAGFMTEAATAFRAGRVGLFVNASFLVGTLKPVRGLAFSVAELPARNGIRANYASYWANALVAGRNGAQRDAAAKFLAFITSAPAMELWTAATGELPARPAAAEAPAITGDPLLAPFARGVAGSFATDFVDEDAQRAVFVNMLDRVLLKGQPPLDSVRQAAAEEQKIIDDYYKKA